MSRMAKDALGRRARRQFSEEFKEGAVRLVLDEGKTIGAVARETRSDGIGPCWLGEAGAC